MRIRIFHAYASNNSGSYTIVGSFENAATAGEIARLIEEISVEHHAWHAEHTWDEDGESPLDRFAREHALRTVKPGRMDEWPAHGPRPTAVAVDHQVLVYAPYTATLTRIFGELIYAKGGRVSLELDHAHADIAVEITYFVRNTPFGGEPETAMAAFEARLREVLPALSARDASDERPPVAPAWRRGSHGDASVAVVFRDLPQAILEVRALAREVGVSLHLRVWESEGDGRDPFAAMRASKTEWGQYRVVLWRLGEDRVAAMKAVREAIGGGLTEAKIAIEELPRELCVDVSERYAKEAVAILCAAGCDAEAVVPQVAR